MAMPTDPDPHRSTPVVTAGAPLEQARLALVLLHGRGSSPQDMLGLAGELSCAHCAYLAPQAAGSVWYPYPFMTPLAQNQPWLDSALQKIETILDRLAEAGFPAAKVALLGFSQGASLLLEYTARHPRRYGAVFGLSGGLIGPPGTVWQAAGSLAGTPIFLGCSDRDPFIPRERVDESAAVLRRMGGQVTERIYPNLGHTVSHDEIKFIRDVLSQLTAVG